MWSEIFAVDVNENINNLKSIFSETGHSKVLIFKENIDDVLGYTHLFGLFRKPKTIKSILLPVEFVPETMLIKDILNNLTKKRKSIAVVLDEYGGTSGILTVEDIVEELFGEIEDEHDSADLHEVMLDPNNFEFSARLEVDYLNATYNLDLPEGENYETIGGLIVNFHEEIPKKDSKVIIKDFVFTILQVSNTKIELVHLNILNREN